MKILKILTILIGALAFSACSSTKYKIIHVPLELPTPCEYEKFTEEEKAAMSEAIGRKIYRNQKSCIIRNQANSDIITIHNELHKGNNDNG